MALRAVNPRISRLVALVVAALLALLAAGSVPEPAAAGTACTKFGEVRAEKLRTRQARAAIRCFLNREREQRGTTAPLETPIPARSGGSASSTRTSGCSERRRSTPR